MGRFMSPDWSATPEAVPYAKLNNPQSLNLYAYVGNNPLSLTDPDGHCGEDGDSCDNDGEDSGNSGSSDPADGQAAMGSQVSDHTSPSHPPVGDGTGDAQPQNQSPLQQYLAQQNRPITSPDWQNTLADAGNRADVGVKAAMVATAPEYLAAGASVAATSGAVEGTVAAAKTAAQLTVNGASAAAETIVGGARAARAASAATQLRLGAAIETFVPGGVAATGQFVMGALSPRSAAPTTAGAIGFTVNIVVKIVSHLF